MLTPEKKNIRREYMNIIPLFQDKTPRVGNWRQNQNHESHTAMAKTDGSEMYGVLTGEANGIIVFDYDTQKEGENIGKVVDVDGAIYDLPKLLNIYGEDAYIVKTRSGGFHAYCVLDERVKQWRNRAGINGYLDIRAEGGYVVGGNSPGYEVVNGDINKLTPVPDEMYNFIHGLQKQKRRNTSRGRAMKGGEQGNEVLVKILTNEGFSNVAFRWSTAPYNFDCDQIGRECPLCHKTHNNNKFFVYEGNPGELFVKNHSESCERKRLASYDAVKLLFERDVCRINDCLLYPCEGDGEKAIIRNKKDLVERYAEWFYKDEENETKSFIYQWLVDNRKRQFTHMDYIPKDCPSDVYNLWSGYAVEEIDPKLGKQGEIKPFLDLLDALTDGETEYALNYLTLLFKNPELKPRTCLVFYGSEGTGKGRFTETLRVLMGDTVFFETNNAESDIFGQFASAFDRTKLVVSNESESKTNFKNLSRLKSLITDETGLKVNRKYHNAYGITNLAGTMITTNEKVAVYLGLKDRRFVVYKTNPKYSNDQEFFKMYMDWLKCASNQRALYDFLISRDIQRVDWVRDRPLTSAYLDMRNSCLPQIVKWLEYFVVEDFRYRSLINPEGVYTFRGTYLRQAYTDYAASESRVTDAAFGRLMKKMIDEHTIPEDCLRKDRNERGTVWFLNRELLFAWLQNKQFTNHEGELPPARYSELAFQYDDNV